MVVEKDARPIPLRLVVRCSNACFVSDQAQDHLSLELMMQSMNCLYLREESKIVQKVLMRHTTGMNEKNKERWEKNKEMWQKTSTTLTASLKKKRLYRQNTSSFPLCHHGDASCRKIYSSGAPVNVTLHTHKIHSRFKFIPGSTGRAKLNLRALSATYIEKTPELSLR
jgi:hypothetical protein